MNISVFDDFFKSINFDYEILDRFDKIYVLISGGIDSTILAEYIEDKYPNRTFFVNNFSPYENNATLNIFKKKHNFVQTKSPVKQNYKKILEDSFKKIPFVIEERKKGKVYHKKMFRCCYHIKHKDFKKMPLFKEKGTCVVSGIKRGDGQQRFFWLLKMEQMKKFIHKHKTGHNYVYPFRDYMKRELPNKIVSEIRLKYPKIKHSGCFFCPILVLFNIESEGERYYQSLRYYHKVTGIKVEIQRHF